MSSYWANKAQSYRKPGYKRVERKQEDYLPTTQPPPLGKLIQSLTVADLAQKTKDFTASATIQAVESVTSYNWLEGKGTGPTILIPGM